MYRCGLDKDIPVTFSEAMDAYRTLTHYLLENGWVPKDKDIPGGDWISPPSGKLASREVAIHRQFSRSWKINRCPSPSGTPGNLEDGA